MTPFDVLEHIEPGRRAVAVRHIPQTLDVFATHFPRLPVLPGVLILDEMVAVAALALSGSTDPSSAPGRWVLAGAGRIRFRRFVRPGDALRIAVEVAAVIDGTSTCRASASVDGVTVTTVTGLLVAATEGESR